MQICQLKNDKFTSLTDIPSRRRALDQISAMKQDAVHPAKIQRYLKEWAHWWARVISPLNTAQLLHAWRLFTEEVEPLFSWVARRIYLNVNAWL